MDLAPFARMDDPLALPTATTPPSSAKARRRFNEDDDEDDDNPMLATKSSGTIDPDAMLKQYQDATSGFGASSPAPTTTTAPYEFEEEKRVESPALPEKVFKEYNNPHVPASVSATQPSEVKDSDSSSLIEDVDLTSTPAPVVLSPSIPVPASLSSPSVKASASPAAKRTYESTMEESEHSVNDGAEESNLNSSLQQESSSSTMAMRNKAMEPSVFWSELREWLQHVEKVERVTVDEPMQMPRTLTNPNPPFTYLVRCSLCPEGVRRRYSDFETLRMHLMQKYPGILMLALPEKKAVGNKNDEFLAERAKGLRLFLDNLVENEYLRADAFTRAFLVCQPAEWESAKKRLAATQQQNPALATGEKAYPFRPAQSPGGMANVASEDRWRAAVHMTRLPEKHEEEMIRAIELLTRLEQVLRSLLTCAIKCSQASKAYATSVKDLHRQFAMSQMVSSLAALQSPVEFWSDASALEPVIIEELLVESLQKELDLVAEMKRMLDARKELMVVADQRLAVLHKFEDECETMRKTGQQDRAARSAQKVQDAMKQVKQADFKLEMMTKAMFLAGLGSFVPARIEALSALMGRFAFGEMRFGDLMKSVWLGVVASLRLDLTQVEADSKEPMEAVRRRVPDKFKSVFATSGGTTAASSSPSRSGGGGAAGPLTV